MPSGIMLCGWDNTFGSVKVASYPPDLTLEKVKSIQYLLAIQKIGTSTTLQIQDDTQIALIYGQPSSVTAQRRFNLNYIVLFLNKSEGKVIESFKIVLNQEGENVITASSNGQIELFTQLTKKLWAITPGKAQNQDATLASKIREALY